MRFAAGWCMDAMTRGRPPNKFVIESHLRVAALFYPPSSSVRFPKSLSGLCGVYQLIVPQGLLGQLSECMTTTTKAEEVSNHCTTGLGHGTKRLLCYKRFSSELERFGTGWDLISLRTLCICTAAPRTRRRDHSVGGAAATASTGGVANRPVRLRKSRPTDWHSAAVPRLLPARPGRRQTWN